MRLIFKLIILFLLILCACNVHAPGKPVSDQTMAAAVTDSAPAEPSDTPVEDNSSTDCAFVWANKRLADLSIGFDTALKAAIPGAEGYAEAYGENCLGNQGEVVRFLTKETDYYVTIQVETLEDKQTLGELTEKVLGVVAQFPVEETPGPQPGYVGINFESNKDEIRLWFTQTDAEAALQKGLHGEELFNAMQGK